MTTRYRKIKRRPRSNTKKQRTRGGDSTTPIHDAIRLFFDSDDEKYPINSGKKILHEIKAYANAKQISVLASGADKVLDSDSYTRNKVFTEVYPLFLMLRKSLADEIVGADKTVIDIKRKRELSMLLRFTKTVIERIQTVERPLWLEKILGYLNPTEFAAAGKDIAEGLENFLALPEKDSAIIANVLYDASDVRKFRGRKINPKCDNKMFAHYKFVNKPDVVRTVENFLTRLYTERDSTVPHENVRQVVAKLSIDEKSGEKVEDKPKP